MKSRCSTFNFHTEMFFKMFDVIRLIIEKNSDLSHLVEKATSFRTKHPPPPREPYATLEHLDLWANNTMQFEKNGKIVKNMFVDYQLFDYRSCAADVFFFLWTSVQKNVLEEHLDDLLKHYHQSLIKVLEIYTIDITPFSYEKFLEEIILESDFEFGHTLAFVFIVKSSEKTSSLDMAKFEMSYDVVTPELEEFIWYMVKECEKRRWIQ